MATTSLVKNYFLRKEKKQILSNEKFGDVPSIKAEVLHPRSINNSRVSSNVGLNQITRSAQLPSISDI